MRPEPLLGRVAARGLISTTPEYKTHKFKISEAVFVLVDRLLKDVRVFSIEFIKLLAGQGLYSLKKYYV